MLLKLKHGYKDRIPNATLVISFRSLFLRCNEAGLVMMYIPKWQFLSYVR
jgi:hypothetical protein